MNGLSVEEVYSSLSYLGQLAGAPDPEEAVRRITSRVTGVFRGNNPPLHVIEPETREVARSHRTFILVPQWAHAALIVGPEVPGGEPSDGAHLLVLWFSMDMTPVIPEVTLETWNAKAKNWRF